jgi:putative ABC transport system ATP-binding protein
MLKASKLRKGFHSRDGVRREVVSVDSFQLAAGEQLALHGESGCGKSTFLQLLAGYLLPDSGQIQVDGTELTTLSESARDRFRAERIGFIFQSCNLLQGCTVLENVLLGSCFGKGEDPAFARHLLERVGLGSHCNDHPRQLSLGQQQRVAVARALVGRPALVLADEPTSSLDHENASMVSQLIREMCTENGAALLLVSHDVRVLETFPQTRPFASLGSAVKGARA